MTNVKTDPAVTLAEAIMADLDCADVFGHRHELIASVERHLPVVLRWDDADSEWIAKATTELTEAELLAEVAKRGRVFAAVIPRGVPVDAIRALQRDVNARLDVLAQKAHRD